MKEQLAAFFKGDYSKVSEKKSVARGGTSRPKAPRTVFGQPAQRKRPQGGPNAAPQHAEAEEQRETRERPSGGAARKGPRIGAAPRAGGRGKPATGGGGRQERDMREERGSSRPTNKGRGRYSAEGKAAGGRDGGRGTGGREGKPGFIEGRGRGKPNAKPSGKPAGRSSDTTHSAPGRKPSGNRPRGKKD